MNLRSLFAVAVAVAGLLACPASAQWIGVTWGGDCVAVFDDGQGATVGATGYDQIQALARLAGGELIAATAGPQPRLIEIDPVSGVGAQIGSSGLNGVRALAVSPEGWLYALSASDPYADLYFLELGAAGVSKVLIGATDVVGIQGAAFSPSGTLYGWSVAEGLVTIDRFTAACVDVSAEVGGTTDVQALAFDPAGELFGARHALYRIDVATGELARVGSGSFGDVRGLEFDAQSFPALSVTPSLAPGDPLEVELQAPVGQAFLIGAAPTAGPICPGTLPFCVDLGPGGGAIVVVAAGEMPANGSLVLALPTPGDPALAGFVLHWQALAYAAGSVPRKSGAASSTFL